MNFAVLVCLLWSSPLLAVEYHVSPMGDDANVGSADAPFATLERARDAVRERREAVAEFEGATVIVHEGRYERRATLVLDANDAGEPNAPVVYRAADGARPLFDGGYLVDPTHFARVDDDQIRERLLESVRDDVLQLDLGALGITDYGSFGPRGWGRSEIAAPMELFIDRMPQSIAQWPNEGSIPLGEVHDRGGAPREGDQSNRSAVFEYNTERAERWVDANDLHIAGHFGVTWAHDTIGIAEVDVEAGTFTTDGAHYYAFAQPGRPANFQTHYVAVNLLEEIEQPGEYFIDREAGKLYILPPHPLTYSTVQLSALDEPFVRIENASHVRIEGLTFENTRGDGIVIAEGSDNRIAGCTFRALGGIAVDMEGGRGHQVFDCDIYYTGRGGIRASGGDRQSLEPAEHRIVNNDIHRFNRWIRGYNPGIRAEGVGIEIEHNHLHHSDHQGITFAGNEHRMAFNELHHLLKDISDMGAIYAGRDPTFAGNVIEHNFFHHLSMQHEGGPGVQAIFFDDDTIYIARVFGNVFYRAGSTGVIKFNGGGGASVANNVSIEGPRFLQETPGDVAGIDRAIRKITTDYRGSHNFPERIAAMRVDEEPYRSRYPYIYETAFHGYNEGTPRWNNVIVRNNDEMRHFVNPGDLNFAIRSNAPWLNMVAEDVYDRVHGADGQDIAFEQIPFGRIGLKETTHRPALGPIAFSKLGPADDTAELDANAVELWWQPSYNADRYHLVVARDRELTDIVLDKQAVTHNVKLDQLEPNRTYYWQVYAATTRSRSNRGLRIASEEPWQFKTAGARE
ncbi:right-handed parallel beta-helix repeat-containing protein [Phycisphaerales bacterium AB-hyl4]|uniref:Right-handed parallel beta-helix repeat-containing protein n=1 Tax=Natronomicrosphaera hydrolytica TaxID=3242702 RepID=A0ABV4U8S7_9BACT